MVNTRKLRGLSVSGISAPKTPEAPKDGVMSEALELLRKVEEAAAKGDLPRLSSTSVGGPAKVPGLDEALALDRKLRREGK